MTHRFHHIVFYLCSSLWLAALPVQDREIWVSGYYPGWIQETVAPAALPWDSITHLLHFGGTVQADGSITLEDFKLTPSHIKATVAAAHRSQKRVLLVLGGAYTAEGFRGASSDLNRERFIANIVSLVNVYGYDGVDLDWEPLEQQYNAAFQQLVRPCARL
ncbi:glycosyl hydrolase family 18 protein [Puniceicoccus vermicola]|uniref:GH18 domain-containing protein n=1 Tax=Puniceicoccus vermicola TaxID=388746 RepID=A0A7X1B1H2_9BACT|nr:glycosyl hydrolase family 18 protein [Puniceicoccus vermicola]MBC2602788.1 hypothetical protein [Puniceicoccus vermicola]